MIQSIAKGTKKTYEAHFKALSDFTEDRHLCPLPLTFETFEQYLKFLWQNGASYNKISTMIAAVNFVHELFNVDPPTNLAAFKRLVKGFKKLLHKPAVPKLPYTKDILARAIDLLTPEASLQLWRTIWRMTLSFFATARWDEMHQLTNKNVTVNLLKNCVEIKVPKSKTLKHGYSCIVYGHDIRKPISNVLYCPVSLTHFYIEKLKALLPADHTAKFSLQTQINTTKNGHYLPLNGKKAISHEVSLKNSCEVLTTLGEDAKLYGEHSGRRGGITETSRAGATTRQLRLQGQWLTDESPQRYIDEASRRTDEISKMLHLE